MKERDLALPTSLAWFPALLCLVHSLPTTAAEPAELSFWLHDFDRNGVEERVASRPGTDEIQQRSSAGDVWEKADYALPEGVSTRKPGTHETRCRLPSPICP